MDGYIIIAVRIWGSYLPCGRAPTLSSLPILDWTIPNSRSRGHRPFRRLDGFCGMVSVERACIKGLD